MIVKTPPTISDSLQARLASIDILRGAVMILMAIDHVRVYAGIPAGGPDFGVFFTRWITHFCAPAFIFLAGTSAFFYGKKHTDLSRFLFVRGVWLVFLELTFLRVAWTFNFDFANYVMAGVIWAIGWCMILMAGLVKLPVNVTGIIGIIVIAGHNLMDSYFWSFVESLQNNPLSGFWKILYVGFFAGPVQLGETGPPLTVLYSIIPWIGVMAAGYAFGNILTNNTTRRDRLCFAIGLGAIALFLILRGFNIYGDPGPWSAPASGDSGGPQMPALFSFLNTSKYPASLLFLLMTLGPTIALIPLLETTRGVLTKWIAVFGRVPFFYYVLHIPLIHALALIVSLFRSGTIDPWLFMNHPMGNPPPPDGYMWSLPLLYLIWAITIVTLYFVCTWFANVKAKRTDWWLRYL